MLQARRWGATVIRLSISSAYWTMTNCNYTSKYAPAVDAAVKAVTSHGMVALLDLHTETQLPCGIVHTQMMADHSAIAFWRDVADRYKGNPLVAFDLYNEPHDITDDVWRDGGWVTNTKQPFLAAGMQEMYDAIRSTGARNLVIATGQDWGNRFPAEDLLDGYNIVYAIHMYTCPISVTECKARTKDPTPILRRWIPAAGRVPLMITEYGWPDAKDGWYNAKVIGFAAQFHWGWIAFGWDGRTDGQFSLISTMGSVYQPSGAGVPVVGSMTFRRA
jgi:hypothetical protein